MGNHRSARTVGKGVAEELRTSGPFSLDKVYTWDGIQYGPGSVPVLPCGLAFELDRLGVITLTSGQRAACSVEDTTTIVLGTFQATANGTGYAIGDIIIYRQTPPDAPVYVNTASNAIVTPGGSDLGPVGGASSSVTVSASVLPTGAATEATLTTIDADTSAIAAAVAGTEVQVDVVSSALPTGAATEATLTAIDADTSALAGAVSGSEIQADIVAPLPAGTNQLGKVAITDGTDDATIRSLTNSNPLDVSIVDATGAQITSFGGGTQYTEGDTDATITGTAFLWEKTGDELSTISTTNPLPVTGSLSVSNTVALAVFKATANGTGYSTNDIIVLRQTPPAAPEYYNATTDAVIAAPTSTDLGPIATASNVVVDSGAITANAGTNLNTSALALETGGNLAAIAGAVAGTEVQVDIVSSALPTGAATETTLATLATETTVAGLGTTLSTLATTTDAQAIRDRLISGGPALGAGATNATTQRATLASDSPGVSNFAAIGETNNAAATTDTANTGLISLVKRLLEKSPSYSVNTTAELTNNLTTSQQLLAASATPNRTIFISNNTNVLAYVGLGNTPTTTTYTFPIAVGATISIEWLGAVNVICAATATGKIQASALTNV